MIKYKGLQCKEITSGRDAGCWIFYEEKNSQWPDTFNSLESCKKTIDWFLG